MMDEYLRFRAGFAEAMDPRLYPIQYLDHLYLAGRAKLFSSENAAVLAEVHVYPTGAKDVHFMVGTGDLSELVELAPEVEAWGRKQGCIGARIESRGGWAKVMKKHGYEPHQIAVWKGL